MLLIEFIIISILVDSQISQTDMVSKILSALNVLEIKWSDIETNRHYNYNWRPSNSLWGKLSKAIFGSNRASHRAKIMNVWRCNRLNIRQRLQNPIPQLHRESVLTFPVSIELHKLPSTFHLTCSDKSFIQSSQVTNVHDLTRVNSNLQVVDFNSTADHPYRESLDSLRYSPSYSNQYEDYSSMENEPIDIGDINHKEYNTESIRSFEIFLNLHEWGSCISPQCIGNTFKQEWTNIFSEKLSEFYPYCVIKFNDHRINKTTSTRNYPYIVAEANCKFKNCIRFKFLIDTIPNSEIENVCVKVNVVGSISNKHFDNKTSNSRKLSALSRQVVGDDLMLNSTSNFHYKQFVQPSSLEVAKHGNLNHLKSQVVLRKVKSEHESKSRLSDDMWQDIVITQKSYESSIKGSHFNGYIQTISRYPIVVHMFTEDQLLLIRKLQSSDLTLHSDATGSVVRKIDKLRKLINYAKKTSLDFYLRHMFSIFQVSFLVNEAFR